MKKHLVDQRFKTLDELGLQFGTDKASSHHDYLKVYERYFEPLRNKELTFLELGYGGHEFADKGGESVRMWREYAPNWDIHCVDIAAKTNVPEGVSFWQVSQTNGNFLENKFGGNGIDVCVDDASHLSSLTIKSFEILFPLLNSGGIYIIEDSHSSYHDWFYSAKEANPNPQRNGTQGLTAMNYFKRLVDGVNNDLLEPKYKLPYQIESITFLKDLIIITKL